jgi:hypothetical protein
LILLAIFTSNPVVLNLRQIEHADYLVKARIDDLRQGRITIERDWQLHPQWVTPLKPGPLQVANLAEARGGRNGRDFLIPLSNVQGRYEVTPAAGPGTIPFIYPATPEVEREMSQALEDLKAHPLASIGRQ